MGETAQQQQSLPATDRGLTKPRRWWVRAALALAFWTGLGLLFSIQGYLLWPDKLTPLSSMQMTMPRWYVWGLLAPGGAGFGLSHPAGDVISSERFDVKLDLPLKLRLCAALSEQRSEAMGKNPAQSHETSIIDNYTAIIDKVQGPSLNLSILKTFEAGANY